MKQVLAILALGILATSCHCNQSGQKDGKKQPAKKMTQQESRQNMNQQQTAKQSRSSNSDY